MAGDAAGTVAAVAQLLLCCPGYDRSAGGAAVQLLGWAGKKELFPRCCCLSPSLSLVLFPVAGIAWLPWLLLLILVRKLLPPSTSLFLLLLVLGSHRRRIRNPLVIPCPSMGVLYYASRLQRPSPSFLVGLSPLEVFLAECRIRQNGFPADADAAGQVHHVHTCDRAFRAVCLVHPLVGPLEFAFRWVWHYILQ